MRGDAYVNSVLERCDLLRRAGLWPSESHLRPREWLHNFDEADRTVAASLLENFQFYNQRMTDRLLLASYYGLADEGVRAKLIPTHSELDRVLQTAVFCPVEGENPNVTDSGNVMCRKARQLLGIPADRIRPTAAALDAAIAGAPVIFVDDFIGSGDQFIKTWTRAYRTDSPTSFAETKAISPFVAIYVAMVATEDGIQTIRLKAPDVVLSVAHSLGADATLHGLRSGPAHPIHDLQQAQGLFLDKYAPSLSPQEHYMQSTRYKRLGFKSKALLFAFEHCVPDATLPIFWSPGPSSWRPLVERA